MPFEAILAAPITWQVAILTAGLTHYSKRLMPERLYDVLCPPIAIIFGIALYLLFNQSILLADTVIGLIIGFSVTSLYGITKEIKRA